MKFFNKGELKLLWPFYLDSLLSPMLFFLPAFMILYFRGLDLSMFQIGILIAVMPLFALLSEIPTGAIADLYGRKFSVTLSYLLGGIFMFLLFFTSNYYSILMLFALEGIALSLSSGAKEAWIVDLTKNKDLLHSYFPKAQGLDSFGLIVSGIIGAFFVKEYGLSIIWIAAGISYIIAFIILLFAKENYCKTNLSIKDTLVNISKQSKQTLRYGYSHKVLFSFFLASAILIVSGNLDGQLSWVPFLQDLQLPEYAFGYMWSIIGLMGFVAPIASQKLLKKGNERRFILISLVLAALVSLSILLVQNLIFAFIVLICGAFLSQLKMPAERIYFHRFIPSRLRATMGSVEGMINSLAGIIAVPFAGFLIDLIGSKYTIALSAITLFIAAIIYYKIDDGSKK